jgi:hypothetical protein
MVGLDGWPNGYRCDRPQPLPILSDETNALQTNVLKFGKRANMAFRANGDGRWRLESR